LVAAARGWRACGREICTALLLGKLTFKIGDAPLGVVRSISRWSHPASRAGQEIADARQYERSALRG
jgi:hypothetical protein